jgi:hypothetical protein
MRCGKCCDVVDVIPLLPAHCRTLNYNWHQIELCYGETRLPRRCWQDSVN